MWCSVNDAWYCVKIKLKYRKDNTSGDIKGKVSQKKLKPM